MKDLTALAQWLVVIGEGGNNSKDGFRGAHLVPPSWYDNLGLIFVNNFKMCLLCYSLKLYDRSF